MQVGNSGVNLNRERIWSKSKARGNLFQRNRFTPYFRRGLGLFKIMMIIPEGQKVTICPILLIALSKRLSPSKCSVTVNHLPMSKLVLPPEGVVQAPKEVVLGCRKIDIVRCTSAKHMPRSETLRQSWRGTM